MWYMGYLLFLLIFHVSGYKMPNSCKEGEFYDSTLMNCRSCNMNISMVPADDGFGCACAPNSIRKGIMTCQQCNATELVTDDGSTCVPRRCQKSGGRVVCRKCPADYISVTQNFDGSPLKEVTCFKCHKGYKALENKCVKCESCFCSRYELVVSGKCLPKRYVLERPKYNDNKLHPTALLEIIKLEYLCTQSDFRACHFLARECVRYFYTTDIAGPCRLWIEKNQTYTGLPRLTLNSNNTDDKISLMRGKNTIPLAVAVYSPNGSLQLHEDLTRGLYSCSPPVLIKIGQRYTVECLKNISDLHWAFGKLFEVYIPGEKFNVLPISIYNPDGQLVQKGTWPSTKFRKIFLIDEVLSTTSNTSIIVYLRKLLITLRIQRDNAGSLALQIFTKAYFATKSPLTQNIKTTLHVEHEMPSAGIQRGLEIWGGVFSSVLCSYALIQWLGTVRRGGLHICFIPLLSAAVADGLYFATLISTLHALAAEAGTLGITLPLSQTEEKNIRTLLYSVVILKSIKIVWINWNQCKSDIFFVDWSQNSPIVTDSSIPRNKYHWRALLLAREWMDWQTKRRVSPIVTVTFTLVMLQILQRWQSNIPESDGYRWLIASITWWIVYATLFLMNWLKTRFLTSSVSLLNVCCGTELSLIVFQEEYYAHYIHGRNEESDSNMTFPGPLGSCRVVCAAQIRSVYKKLTNNGYDLNREENESNHVLLSKFLSAFFERALDGLSWVANERTIFERILDVELTSREESNISTLLYDIGDNTPSCLALTWWGEELTIATFDCMLYGSVLLATKCSLTAALTTLLIYQLLKEMRSWFGYRNLRQKTGVEL